MKVIIKGNNVTPEKFAEAIQTCERDHGLKVKKAVVFLEFEDHLGRSVQPLQDGHEITRNFYFQKPGEIKIPQPTQQEKTDPVDPISAREMIDLCAKAAHRMLSSNEMKILIALEKVQKPERQIFKNALRLSMQEGRSFSAHYLEQLVLQQYNNK